uniref:Uncharacterized protein n=1 Tax=Arundo donax TaxID=35708 RepID=A0A0A9H5L4_ARUDO
MFCFVCGLNYQVASIVEDEKKACSLCHLI